jgi:nondiscriminating aspartyl-tRNA synthetase
MFVVVRTEFKKDFCTISITVRMRKLHYIGDMPTKPGSKVRIGGRVSRIKELKNAKFIWVRDSTGMTQLTILKSGAPEAVLKAADETGPNDFVVVEGTVPDEIKANFGSEMLPTSIEIVSKSLRSSPIEIERHKRSALDKRLDWRALDLREPDTAAIFKVQSKLVEGMQKYLFSQGFLEIFTPSIMGTISEGGAEVFSLSHFGKDAFLRQDPQLHRDLMMIAGFEKVFEVGPSWRAELSNTPMHLSEHRTIACEIAFISDEYDVMRLEENLVVHGIESVVKDCKNELNELGVEVKVPRLPFPVLEFPKIYDLLESMGKKMIAGQDIDRDAERLLGKYVHEKHKSEFFFINRFPSAVKPFYVMRLENEPEWARSTDMIFKGLELSSGGQREHRYERIVEQAREKGLNLENLKWFTDFFKYGAPPHGGFSIGIERFTMKLLNLQNVRETTLFPRAPERVIP